MTMKIDVNLIGSAEAIKSLGDFLTGTNTALTEVIQKGAFDIERDAKQLCPVDTGRLRASITHEMTSEASAKIGTNVDYAPWVEFETGRRLAPVGTTWSRRHGFGNAKVIWVSGKARPYLYPALAKNQDKINRNIEEAIKKVANK